jgi:hypothetical protein
MPYGCRRKRVTVVHNVLQIKQLLLRTGVPINPKVLGAQTV